MWTILKIFTDFVAISGSCFGFFDFEACESLAPWPGIEPASPAIGRWNLNHWTAREGPLLT